MTRRRIRALTQEFSARFNRLPSPRDLRWYKRCWVQKGTFGGWPPDEGNRPATRTRKVRKPSKAKVRRQLPGMIARVLDHQKAQGD